MNVRPFLEKYPLLTVLCMGMVVTAGIFLLGAGLRIPLFSVFAVGTGVGLVCSVVTLYFAGKIDAHRKTKGANQ